MLLQIRDLLRRDGEEALEHISVVFQVGSLIVNKNAP